MRTRAMAWSKLTDGVLASFMRGRRNIIGLFIFKMGCMAMVAAPRQPVDWEYQVSAAKGPYFLCDTRVLEDRWLLNRVSPPFRKHPANPVMVKAFEWEGTGLWPAVARYDAAHGLYRMWYGVWVKERYYSKEPFAYNVAYAESEDGLVWKRPVLGVFDRLPEDPRNNLIKLGREKTQGIDVEFNPKPDVFPGRFIALHNEAGGLRISTSDDGKAFTWLQEEPTLPYHSDTANNLVYDEVRDRWLIYCRPRAYAGDHKRRVSVQISKDLRNWTHERTILIPDEDEAPEYYGMTVFRRADLFFGMLQVFDRTTGSMHMELAWSEDGLEWRLIGDHPVALAVGAEGEWDSEMVVPAEGPVPVGDELWFYYAGAREPHLLADQAPAAGLAIADRDRLIGLRPAQDQTGFALTRPFSRPTAGDLVVNATIEFPEGSVRVELRDDFGDPIPGFTAEECDPVAASGFEAPVRWRGRSISEAPVGEMRLRFEIRDATLFTYDFSEQPGKQDAE